MCQVGEWSVSGRSNSSSSSSGTLHTTGSTTQQQLTTADPIISNASSVVSTAPISRSSFASLSD